MPKDPIMLLSYVNTQLRDNYESLDELCASEGVDRQEIEEKLKGINYSYNKTLNKFE